MPTSKHPTRPLDGTVAIVTGASRGAGRGIAVELGAAGATVYVTGRSTRESPADTYAKILALSNLSTIPGTIDDTADAVTAAGGHGIPLRCDHTREEEVRALFERVQRDHGKVDVLVNNAWGGHESFDAVFEAPFWEHSLEHWDSMFDRGVRNHILASRLAAPIMIARRRGLIATTTFWDRDHYLRGNFFYDLAKATMNRIAFALAQELRPHNIASVAVSPGWMRTELVLAGHHATEETWRSQPSLARTESPRYLGRAIAHLAADPAIMEKTGQILRVADLARAYSFTDLDGRLVEPFEIDAAEPAQRE